MWYFYKILKSYIYYVRHIHVPNLANHFMREREIERERENESERERESWCRVLSNVTQNWDNQNLHSNSLRVSCYTKSRLTILCQRINSLTMFYRVCCSVAQNAGLTQPCKLIYCKLEELQSSLCGSLFSSLPQAPLERPLTLSLTKFI